MSIGTINVGNPTLATNISTFLKSFASSLGITPSSSRAEARTLGRKLAEPINWLLGGRVDGKELTRDLTSKYRVNGAQVAAMDSKFPNNKFPQGIFMPDSQRPLLDHAYSQHTMQGALPKYFDDKEGLLELATDITSQLKLRGVFDYAGGHPDGLINLVNLPVRSGAAIGLDTPGYGQTGFFFNEKQLDHVELVQKPNDKIDFTLGSGKPAVRVDRAAAAIFSVLEDAIRRDDTMNVIPALNRFINAQYLPADKIH